MATSVSTSPAITDTPGEHTVGRLPEHRSRSSKKAALITMKTKILQSYAAYSMLVQHVPSGKYVEFSDDTITPLQILDSTKITQLTFLRFVYMCVTTFMHEYLAVVCLQYHICQ